MCSQMVGICIDIVVIDFKYLWIDICKYFQYIVKWKNMSQTLNNSTASLNPTVIFCQYTDYHYLAYLWAKVHISCGRPAIIRLCTNIWKCSRTSGLSALVFNQLLEKLSWMIILDIFIFESQEEKILHATLRKKRCLCCLKLHRTHLFC